MTSLVSGVVPATDFVVSATQISTFEDCPRKWAFRWLDGIQAPPSKYADLGIDTHGHLEDWLRHGVVPTGMDKSVQLAQAMIPHLPPPQAVEPQNVELDQYYTLCDVKFNLKVDLFMPQNGSRCILPRPIVFDHKTCGDPMWALSADQLVRDIQGSLYGGWALHLTGAEGVDLRWNYVFTKGSPRVLPVVKENVRGRDVQERLGLSLESARKMRVFADSGAKAMQFEYNPRACNKYGGCPHQAACNLSARERMSSLVAQATAAKEIEMSGNTEDFLRSLAQGQNGQGQAPMNFGGQPQGGQQPMSFGGQQPMQQQPMQQQPMQQQPMQQQPMQQQPMQQQPMQQQPMGFGPPPGQQQPMQQQPMQGQQLTGFGPPPQQQPLQGQQGWPTQPPQQQPLAYPPTQGTVLEAAQPQQGQAAAKPGPGRPAKAKASEDPWVQFAAGAPVPIGLPPDQAAQYAAQYADYLGIEYARRKS